MDFTLGRWQPFSVDQVVLLFAEAPFRWWISGGHALELHIGDIWRNHEDLDVGVCRYQMPDVYRWLREWDLHIAAGGSLAQWDGRPLDADLHENNVWVRESQASPWRFDLTIGSGSPQRWAYRRDESVTRPWDRAVLNTLSGTTPYLAPDLQLLFKAKEIRPKDDVDARRVIPSLVDGERRFLIDQLPPEHPWQSALVEASRPHF